MPINQPSGPPKAFRPFQPRFGQTDPVERIAHALEHIATALAAIDHNLQLLVTEHSMTP
jgi:hypothetical protein